MGRHGGGSRSGGISGGSRGGSGTRGSGSKTRISKIPFQGCYNRSYYDRRGRYHRCYTSDVNFGKKSGWNIGMILALIFVTIHMLLMLGTIVSNTIHFGSKVNGNVNRIQIVDSADVLTAEEEKNTMVLLQKIYQASGMPVTIYTDTFDWKQHYTSLETYSEELYYHMGFDEESMIILFTTDKDGEFADWEYDMYCGDKTTDCLSDEVFARLLDNFQKGMATQSLYQALTFSWNSIMDDLARTSINWNMFPVVIMCTVMYGFFYITILGSRKMHNDAYRYFRENPNQYETTPMTLYSECPCCGAANTEQREICSYCGAVLKISDGKVRFIKPE